MARPINSEGTRIINQYENPTRQRGLESRDCYLARLIYLRNRCTDFLKRFKKMSPIYQKDYANYQFNKITYAKMRYLTKDIRVKKKYFIITPIDDDVQ